MIGTTTLRAPYADAAELDATRRQVEQLVCDLPGGDPDQLAFEHPWEIRAFAMAVTAHHQLGFDWPEFQHALITSIRGWETTNGPAIGWSYYEHWVTALEDVLSRAGLLDGAVLDLQTRTVLATPPNRNHHAAHTEPIAIEPAVITPA